MLLLPASVAVIKPWENEEVTPLCPAGISPARGEIGAQMFRKRSDLVIAGLDPAIHARMLQIYLSNPSQGQFGNRQEQPKFLAWIAGSSPAMTKGGLVILPTRQKRPKGKVVILQTRPLFLLAKAIPIQP